MDDCDQMSRAFIWMYEFSIQTWPDPFNKQGSCLKSVYTWAPKGQEIELWQKDLNREGNLKQMRKGKYRDALKLVYAIGLPLTVTWLY